MGGAAAFDAQRKDAIITKCHTKLFAIGDNGKDKEKVYKEVEVTDPVKKHYKKMYFVNNRFVGGILIGDISESGLFTDAFQDQYTMERML